MILDRFIKPNQRIIFSIGYEKRTLSEFIELLISYKVKRIVDIRLNPYSENQSFSEGRLRNILKSNGIDYIHVSSFSPPLGMRRKYQASKDFEGFSKEFSSFLEVRSKLIRKWTETLEDADCLMCYEKVDTHCHRSLIYKYIQGQVYPIQ